MRSCRLISAMQKNKRTERRTKESVRPQRKKTKREGTKTAIDQCYNIYETVHRNIIVLRHVLQLGIIHVPEQVGLAVQLQQLFY